MAFVSTISVFVTILLTVHQCVYSSFPKYSCFRSIPLPAGVIGPEPVAFDPREEGHYVGVADGRVLKWQGPAQGFVDFATTSSNRSKELCDGTIDPNLGATCGRPLGLSFNSKTGVLYIADAYLGLQAVGPNGGLATVLVTIAQDIEFRLLTGVVVDQRTGFVYISSATTTYDLRNISQPDFMGDPSGRLLKYDPRTKRVTVLLRELEAPIGPAVSYDSTFILVSEYTTKRNLRYWLTDPKANSVEVFLNLPGIPVKIKRDNLGNFWVAVTIFNARSVRTLGFRVNSFGSVLQIKKFDDQYYNTSFSSVQEYNGALHIGGLYIDFVGVYYSNI